MAESRRNPLVRAAGMSLAVAYVVLAAACRTPGAESPASSGVAAGAPPGVVSPATAGVAAAAPPGAESPASSGVAAAATRTAAAGTAKADPMATGHAANSADRPATMPASVIDPQRAWQNWTLNCQGCHRPDGTGSEGTAPSLAGTVSKFLNVPGGRDYLGRVPGVATSPLSNADLADLMNWMFWRFDPQHMPADFAPFTAAEIGSLRTRPLRLEASALRADLLRQAESASRESTAR